MRDGTKWREQTEQMRAEKDVNRREWQAIIVIEGEASLQEASIQTKKVPSDRRHGQIKA